MAGLAVGFLGAFQNCSAKFGKTFIQTMTTLTGIQLMTVPANLPVGCIRMAGNTITRVMRGLHRINILFC